MTYAQAMAAESRDLTIRGTVTLPDSTVIHLAASQIMAYSIDEGATEIPLGAAASASYALEVANASGEWFRGGSIMTNRVLKGAKVEMEIGVFHDGAYDYKPAGVWYVERGSGKEGTTRYVLRGGDQLMYMTEALDDSTFTYSGATTLNAILNAVKSVHGLTIYGTLQCNAAAIISKRPDWGAGCSVRNALGFIAAAGGCFIQVARDGKLTLVPVKKTGTARAIATGAYLELENTNETFAFNRIKVMPRGAAADDPYIQSYILSGLGETGKNTIVMADNPLFASGATNLQDMVDALKTVLTGYSVDTFSFRHRGDPTWALGDLVTVTDRRAKTVTTPILQQTLKYGNGFSSMISSMLPLEITAPSTISRNGTIMSIGFGQGSVDPSVLIAHSITAEQIEAGSITADEIAADSITTVHLQAGAITADKAIIANGAITTAKIADAAIHTAHIDDAAITRAKIASALITSLKADAIDAVSARIQELVAGSITTDQLYSDIATIAVAQLTTANIINASIDWATITNLTAEVADIAVAQITTANIDAANINWAAITALGTVVANIALAEIGTADIDWAQIKDLIAGTSILTKGVGGEFYFSKLAVTEANMVSLTVGELLVKGADGTFYTVGVNESGEVITTPKLVEGDNIADATINGSTKIIEGSITAETLNVESIFAENAVIAQMIAANLDVDTLFAREATVNALNIIDINDIGGGYIRLGPMVLDGQTVVGVALGEGLSVDGNGNLSKDGLAGLFVPGGISLYQNADVVATFMNNAMTTKSAMIEERMNHGDKWLISHDHGYTIKWIGG